MQKNMILFNNLIGDKKKNGDNNFPHEAKTHTVQRFDVMDENCSIYWFLPNVMIF